MFQIFAMKIKVFLRHFFVKLFELFCGIWTMHVTSMTVACKYNIFKQANSIEKYRLYTFAA